MRNAFRALPRFRRFGVALALLALAGCSTLPPPTLPPAQPRRGMIPRSYKMKLAVLNFVDQTGTADVLVETIPDVLATELFNTEKRFEVKERAELREFNPNQIEEVRQKYKTEVDAFLVGSVTRNSESDHTLTLDVRAINAENGTVMYAGNFNIRYSGDRDVKVNRDDITKIAEDLLLAFPPWTPNPDIKIVSKSGANISINLGQEGGARIGMGVLIVAEGETLLRDPVSGENLGNEVFVGEAYVYEVAEKTCKARIAENSQGIVKLGDFVRFK